MTRWLVVLALVACSKHDDTPRIKLDGGEVVASKADAAAPADAAMVVHEGPTIVQLAVGPHAACAAMSDGSARCWGDNGDGELGNGTRTDSADPVTPKLRGVKQLALGDSHACARLDDGSVACWGKIGFGAQAQHDSPTAVPGVTNVQRVWAIGGAGCAGDAAGKIVCWGDVDAAGRVTATGAHRTPSPVLGLDHIVGLTGHAALRDDGDVTLWGGSGAPARVGTQGIVELVAFDRFTCGRTKEGAIECYGADQPCPTEEERFAAKLKRYEATHQPPPPKPVKPAKPTKPTKPTKPATPVKPPPTGPGVEKMANLLAARKLAGGSSRLCTLTTAGRVQCLAVNEDGCGLVTYGHLVRVVDVAGSCARLADGSVRCWTADPHSHDSVPIKGIAGATALDTSGDRACAVVGPRAIACWNGIGDARTIDL